MINRIYCFFVPDGENLFFQLLNPYYLLAQVEDLLPLWASDNIYISDSRSLMDCKLYCMGISIFSVFFLFYLGCLVAFGSETLYIEVNNRLASAFALYFSAIIYAVIFAYLYWDRFVNIDRKADLKRWLAERKADRKHIHEMREINRQSQMVSMARESSM